MPQFHLSALYRKLKINMETRFLGDPANIMRGSRVHSPIRVFNHVFSFYCCMYSFIILDVLPCSLTIAAKDKPFFVVGVVRGGVTDT